MMKRTILFLFAAGLLFSCTASTENKTQKIAENYLDLFSKRKELDRILSFYSADFEYRNVSFESDTNDPKFLFEQFYGWKDQNYKYQTDQIIEIRKIVTNDSTIVVTGKSMPYTYNGKPVEGNEFVIWLDLDKDYKIKKQTDWFDYPMEEIIEAYNLKNSFKIQ